LRPREGDLERVPHIGTSLSQAAMPRQPSGGKSRTVAHRIQRAQSPLLPFPLADLLGHLCSSLPTSQSPSLCPPRPPVALSCSIHFPFSGGRHRCRSSHVFTFASPSGTLAISSLANKPIDARVCLEQCKRPALLTGSQRMTAMALELY